jgi:hypothetical protein
MSTRKLGIALLVTGAAIVVLSVAADLFSAGPRGLQAAQLLGVEAGVAGALAGAWLSSAKPERTLSLRALLQAAGRWLLGLPNLAWIMAGFAVIYLALFIAPMFLNSSLRMEYFTGYLPDRSPIGNDLVVVTDLIRSWFSSGQSPYVEQFYPPFVYVSFSPLVLLEHAEAYRLITLVSIACFAVGILTAWNLANGKGGPLNLIVLVTGLVSYGLQFELERGQFNVIAMTLVMTAIWLFHHQPRWRPLAYALFTVAVQLKVYPAIFALMLIDNWRDWRTNLKRLAGLAALNAGLLLVAGYRLFIDFVQAVTTQMVSPTMNFWNGNHSIKAFVFGLGSHGYGLIPKEARPGWARAAPAIEAVLLSVLVACVVLVIARLYRQRESGPSGSLLLACTMAALMVPISNDYKLAILAAPMALGFATLPEARLAPRRGLTPGLLFISAAAYASLLIPFKYKPFYLWNSYPALLVILLSMTALGLLQKTDTVPATAEGAATSRQP